MILAEFTYMRRPFISDIFKSKYVTKTFPEKTYDEPEDDKCDIYINI